MVMKTFFINVAVLPLLLLVVVLVVVVQAKL